MKYLTCNGTISAITLQQNRILVLSDKDNQVLYLHCVTIVPQQNKDDSQTFEKLTLTILSKWTENPCVAGSIPAHTTEAGKADKSVLARFFLPPNSLLIR
jgi:hypothetical protein